MLLSFLKVDPETELRNRKRKASKEKLNNRALKVIARNRVQCYEDSRRIKEIVPEVLDECVDAVSKQAARRVIKRSQTIEEKKRVSNYRGKKEPIRLKRARKHAHS